MPYSVRKRDDQYCVIKDSDQSTLACHATREEAEDQITAIEINENAKTIFDFIEKQDGYKPTDGMIAEAKKGLAWRNEFGRGGTAIGVARARDISNGRSLPMETIKRMHSFFSRHEVDKKAEGFRPGEDGYPSNGRIAWALWGGDAGQSWAAKLANRDETKKSLLDVLKIINGGAE
jgi:hypothetical protein